jgi:26S proteasome regulatory subunit N2
MILIQQSDAASRSIANTRALFSKIIADKHEDPMARFGASLAQGLIDAGGRNVTISLQSRSGSRNMSAIVGMALFTQFWYWYPLAHCACLAFQPTAIIGLTEEMKAPVFEFVSNARPSLFAYPASTKPPTKESVEKVATAVLSTTAKAKAREKTKEKKAAADAMDMDEKPESKPAQSPEAEMKDATDDTKKTDIEMKDEGTTTKRRTPEPTSEKLSNFSRVTPAQLSYIRFPLDGRFHPVRAVTSFPVGKPSSSKSERYAGGGGIVILVDRTPGAPNEWVQPFASQDAAPAPATDAPEADPPPAFEYPFEQST